MMQVKVLVRNVYGVSKAYPVNKAAKLFAAIAGTKTLTVQTLAQAQQLGYQIIQETPATELAFVEVEA